MKASTQARGIVQSCIDYAAAHQHRYPTGLGDLLRGNDIPPEYLISPFTDKPVPPDLMNWPAARQDNWIRKNSSFVLIPGSMADDGKPVKDKAVVFLKPADSNGKGISVCFKDDHVRWIPLAEAEKLIEAQTGKTIQQLVAASKRGE